jgi:hypothetical protein
MAHGVSQAMQVWLKLAVHALPSGVGHGTLRLGRHGIEVLVSRRNGLMRCWRRGVAAQTFWQATLGPNRSVTERCRHDEADRQVTQRDECDQEHAHDHN